MCEVFKQGRCFGCIGLALPNIDELKKVCETYKEETNDRVEDTNKSNRKGKT